MNESKKRLLYIGCDYLSTLLAVLVFSLVRYYWIDKLHYSFSLATFLSTRGVFLTALLFPPFMLILYYLSGYYVRVNFKSRIREFIATLISTAIGALCYFMIVLLNDLLPKRTSNYLLILILFTILFIIVFSARCSLTTIITAKAKRMNRYKRLIFVGDADQYAGKEKIFRNQEYTIVGKVLFNRHDEMASHEEIRSRLSENLKKENIDGFDGFYFTPPNGNNEFGLRILGELYAYDTPIFVNSDNYRLLTSKVVYENILSDPLMDISRSELPDSVVAIKRATDIALSSLALILVSPIVMGFAIAVKMTSRGPIFYRQERIGYHRRPFKLIKLRSMIDGAEKSGPALSSSSDPRITPLGAFMRKYRIDELPNLWNVVKGDMSLVGPRPEREYFLKELRRVAPYCSLLHQVRPGLTSLGMVKFGYASSVDEMVERLKYDLIYIQNLSIPLDIRIMLYTIRTVLRGEGK